MRRFDQCKQAAFHAVDAADDQPLALPRDALAVDGRIGIGGSLLRRGQRRLFTLATADKVQVRTRGDPLGLRIAVGHLSRPGEDRVGSGKAPTA